MRSKSIAIVVILPQRHKKLLLLQLSLLSLKKFTGIISNFYNLLTVHEDVPD